MPKYRLEFILNMSEQSPAALRNSLAELGEALEIIEEPKDNNIGKTRSFIIRLNTENPTVIFDTCAEFGRMKSVKVEEERS